MKTPRLNCKLTLERQIETPDGAGGRSLSWESAGTLWAEVTPRVGRLMEGESGAVSALQYKVTVRAAPYGSDLRPVAGQRFLDPSRALRIDAVTEADPSGHYLMCFVTEERAT